MFLIYVNLKLHIALNLNDQLMLVLILQCIFTDDAEVILYMYRGNYSIYLCCIPIAQWGTDIYVCATLNYGGSQTDELFVSLKL